MKERVATFLNRHSEITSLRSSNLINEYPCASTLAPYRGQNGGVAPLACMFSKLEKEHLCPLNKYPDIYLENCIRTPIFIHLGHLEACIKNVQSFAPDRVYQHHPASYIWRTWVVTFNLFPSSQKLKTVIWWLLVTEQIIIPLHKTTQVDFSIMVNIHSSISPCCFILMVIPS